MVLNKHGSHVDAVLQGVTFGIMRYFQAQELTQEYRISEQAVADVVQLAVHVRLTEPLFSGCVKNKLANPEFIKPVAQQIATAFYQQLITRPEEEITRLIRSFRRKELLSI